MSNSVKSKSHPDKSSGNKPPVVEIDAEDGDPIEPPPPELVEPDPEMTPEEAEQARKDYLLTRFRHCVLSERGILSAGDRQRAARRRASVRTDGNSAALARLADRCGDDALARPGSLLPAQSRRRADGDARRIDTHHSRFPRRRCRPLRGDRLRCDHGDRPPFRANLRGKEP